MVWNGVKAASNQAKERIDRKLLASFGSDNRHGNPRHVDIKSSLGGGYCRIDLYEKATERSGWLLGCVTLRELLPEDRLLFILVYLKTYGQSMDPRPFARTAGGT